MTRTLRYASYACAVGFFLLFQGLNVKRTLRYARLGTYSRSVIEFLGMRVERERYLLIRYCGKTRGYSGLRVERLMNEENARYRVTLEGFARIIPWLGSKGEVTLDSEAALDDRGRIVELKARLRAAGKTFHFIGRTEGEELLLRVSTEGPGEGVLLKLPAELALGGVAFPVPPLGEFDLGMEREIPYFDPITQRQAVCKVRAVRRSNVWFKGLKFEALILEVKVPVGTFEITAGEDGDILAVKGPGGIELRRSTLLEVRTLFGGKRFDRRNSEPK